MTKTVTGSRYIIDFLKEKGVGTVFGYPGATVLDLYEALRKSGIRHVLVRHEQSAAAAACGYAKASGCVGVCFATSGPGATNLVTGIADAYLDSVPMLIITGQVEKSFIGRDAFQEADIMGITIPVTKHNYLVKDAQLLSKTLSEAWSIATSGRKGPVLVDISKDVLGAPVTCSAPQETLLPRLRDNDYRMSGKLTQIKEAIENSYRPLILAGGGIVASGAEDALCAFARKGNIPLVTTLMGMNTVYDSDINYLGMTGMYGKHAANEAMAQCDLLIAVGTRFSDRTVGNYKLFSQSRMIIHCDIDTAELGKNINAAIEVACDAGKFFNRLSELDISFSKSHIESWGKQLGDCVEHDTAPEPSDICHTVLQILNGYAESAGDVVFVSDVGSFQPEAAKYIKPVFKRGFITSGGLGMMGFGLPGSIGAGFALSDKARSIVLLCGDGGFQMTMQELATLRVARVPVKIFIFNNGTLEMIKTQQEAIYGAASESVLTGNPDFIQIGKAYGLKTERIAASDSRSLTEATVRKIMKYPGHVLTSVD